MSHGRTIILILAATLWLEGAASAQPAAATGLASAAATSVSSSSPGPASLPVAPLATKKARVLADKLADEHDPAGASAKDRERWQAQLDQRIGRPPTEVISIFNTWTHEFLPVVHAEDVPEERIDSFFRCHFTNQPTDMDGQLFHSLVDAAHHFGKDRINIVSGYRAPKYNLMLRKKGREVARKSQHTLGSAIDFRLPGVPVRRLHAWARSLRLGGVGFYPSSGFIHMDTGPVRYWQGR